MATDPHGATGVVSTATAAPHMGTPVPNAANPAPHGPKPGDPGSTPPPVSNGLTSDQSSAKGILDTFFGNTGLAGLADWAWKKYLQGDSPEQIMLEARATPEYKARFPGMEELAKQGNAISEASYIHYEEGVRSLVQKYGLPKGLYDTPQAIAGGLTNHVDITEAEDRVKIAAAAAYTAPQSVRDAITSRYGGAGGLIAMWLDPDKALPVLQKEWDAAQITGAGSEQGIAVDNPTADSLAARGITFDQARQGFGQVAQTQGLESGQGEVLSQQERTAAAFGDVAAQTAQTRVIKGRLAQFSGGGNLAESNTGVSGLGASTSR